MSAVIVIDPALRAKVANILSDLAVHYPKSIGARIRPGFFDAVVDETAKRVNLAFPDFESACIAACAYVEEKKIVPDAFWPRGKRPKHAAIFAQKELSENR